MPRGKNYVNNNKGVSLQANPKVKASMKLCEYGAGCTRPDCIYRHEGGAKRDEVCLPFLAGKCTFKDSGCRKRHPKKEEKARLIAKYKRTRCRFGDECYTDGCLYLHPKETEAKEPNYIEPHHVAFPPLSAATVTVAPRPVPNSAWKAAPLVVKPTAAQPEHSQHQVMPEPQQPPSAPNMMQVPQNPMDFGLLPQGWHPMEAPMYTPYYAPPPYYDPSAQGYPPMAYYGGPVTPHAMPYAVHFNAEAKEFVPGNPTA